MPSDVILSDYLTISVLSAFIGLLLQFLVKPVLQNKVQQKWYSWSVNVSAVIVGMLFATIATIATVSPLGFPEIITALMTGILAGFVAIGVHQGITNIPKE